MPADMPDSRAGDSAHPWSPSSWKNFPALQQPKYPDASALERALEELAGLPPLVTSWEIIALQEQLADAALGRRFVLQAGDCAERISECSSQRITNKLKILLQMSLLLVQGAACPVIRIGRFAGQYAKPRSSDLEERDGVRLPSYRGDLINKPEFTPESRTADPQLLIAGYERAALTLNYIRALIKGGFADLHHPEYWDLDWAECSPMSGEYHRRIASVKDSLRFMENILGIRAGDTDRIDFYTSHEALHLGYEQAQTRRVPRRAGWFNLATHYPWIGIRTSSPDGAHAEYMRGIDNPLAVKVGPPTGLDDLLRLIDVLNPHNRAGRLTLIHRFGVEKVEKALPQMIKAVHREGKIVLWVCDPMHGNTRTTTSGYKTRSFDDIETELRASFDIHRSCGSRLGGVHIELTGENVTECTGGARGLSDDDLSQAYESEVDPRLNYEQAVEIAMLVAGKLASIREEA
jgi:3-deoxy-7-phosphoheptulonate synthase